MTATAKLYRPRSLTPGMALRRAVAIVDTSNDLSALAQALTATTGRPRKVPFRAVLVALVLHGIGDGTNMHLTKAAGRLAELPTADLARLGVRGEVGYHHIQQAVRKLRRCIEEGQLVLPDPQTGTNQALTLDDVVAAVLEASRPTSVPVPTSVALDGRDYETPARRREYVDPRTGEVLPSADPDARIGHRTRTSTHDNEFYVGYEVHLLTAAADRPRRRQPLREHPHLVLAMTVRAPSTDRGPAGAKLLIDHSRRHATRECLADRGYTQASLTNFRLPVLEVGIQVVMDLTRNQRIVKDATVPGILLVDGHPFISAMPQHLRKLAPPKLSDDAATKAKIHAAYDARRPYAFTPLTAVDPVTGTQRFRGPALRGHVRCPNDPRSVGMSRKIPPTTCTKGEPCACSRNITLKAQDHLQTRQPDLYGTTGWKASYSRRVAIESTNAETRNHRADINRGYTRVFGLTGTSLLLAFGMAGLNVRILHDWHESRGLPDPWAGTVDEPPDSRPRQKAITRRRKTTLLERLSTGTDPPVNPRSRH